MTETAAGAGDPFDAVYRRILEGSAPLQVRSAAARGALPLPRPRLVHLFLVLSEDDDAAVKSSAEASLAGLSIESLPEILGDPHCPVEVLRHFAPVAARNEKLAELLAFHAAADDGVLETLASQGGASVIELVLTNQQRLLASPGLIDKLSSNPALRHDQRGRILDLLDRFLTRKTDGAGSAGEGEEAVVDTEEAARLLEVDVGELFAASEIVDGEEFAQSDDVAIRTAYQKILTLNTAQKAILAMKGGREERTILIRDTNKVVALAVLKNGRLTEQEVEGIARMRNVSDEVLRLVGVNREWSKSYSIASNLVRNPRTPPSVSTNFVSRLTNKDLKTLAGDRGAPEIIRRMAKKTLDIRNQPSSPIFKKK